MATMQEMRISTAAAFTWIILLGLAAWVVGLYPTYLLAGKSGLVAQAVASVVVLLATGASALVIARLAVRGPKVAAMGMLLSGFARLILIVAALLVVRRSFELPLLVLLLWTGVFYVVMFGGEVIWLTRAISYDNFLVALGDINRDEDTRLDRPSGAGDDEK
ncbi:MAG: hypothetical protein QGG42_01265 [Phycisphaerae bacterium]|jgi:hypothetical protein|nr:hypothetical protein [Phycisphaerae bacterium]